MAMQSPSAPAGASLRSSPGHPLPSIDPNEALHPQGKPCKVCGGLVEPGDKFCHACGTVQETAPSAPVVEQKKFRCQNCSAEIAVDPGQRSFACPFCASTYV